MKPLKTSRSIRKSAPRRERPREQGQIIVLFVFVLIIILGAAAVVIDVGVLRNTNQNLWNALDAGALAGAQELPDDPDTAAALAMQYAELNFPATFLPASSRASDASSGPSAAARARPTSPLSAIRGPTPRGSATRRSAPRSACRSAPRTTSATPSRWRAPRACRTDSARPSGSPRERPTRWYPPPARARVERDPQRPSTWSCSSTGRRAWIRPTSRTRAVPPIRCDRRRRTTRRNSGWPWASSARRPRTTSASRTTPSSARIPTAPRI